MTIKTLSQAFGVGYMSPFLPFTTKPLYQTFGVIYMKLFLPFISIKGCITHNKLTTTLSHPKGRKRRKK